MIKLKYATLHGLVHTPDLGQLGPKLTSEQDPGLKQTQLEMTDDRQTLYISVKGKKTVIKVPISNVAHYVEADEPTK